MTKMVHLQNVEVKEARKFGEFLLGKAVGVGVPENPNLEKASLGRDAEGRVIAHFKGRVLARGGFDRKNGQACVELMPAAPEKFHDKIVEMFQNAYTDWHADIYEQKVRRVHAKVQEILDPPKNGQPSVDLDAVTRSDIEELSLKDVMPEVLPENISLVRFVRKNDIIRVYYELKDEDISVPLLTAQNTAEGTKLTSGDGKSPAPVAFFLMLLDAAKAYNLTVSGPDRLKGVMKGMTKDMKDRAVTEAFINYLEEAKDPIEYSLSNEVQIALVPATQSAYVFIDRKMIAHAKPATDEPMWVRPGFGWSTRTEFAQSAFVEAGRRMIAENIIGVGKTWEKDLEAGLE